MFTLQKLFLGTAVLASAATLPAHAQPAATVSWSGPYIGGFGGYGGGRSAQHDDGFVYIPPTAAVAPTPPAGGGGDGEAGAPPPAVTPTPPATPAPIVAADGTYGLHGGLGGGLVGYNIQVYELVLGLEGDVAGTGIHGSSGFCGTPFHACGTSIGLTADVRGRVGYAFDKVLPFVAGGLAIGHVHAYDSLFGANGGSTQTGYTIGAGIEYRLAPRLSVRVEYLHSDYGTHNLFSILPGVPERITTQTEVVRAGLSYGLYAVPPAPVVAKY